VRSARALDRLYTHHVAYQWLCGGVPMNYRALADFRTAQGAFLDTLLTHGVAVLLAAGVVTLERVAQEGVKVRASAGAASFRRRTTRAQYLADAATPVQARRAEREADPGATTARASTADPEARVMQMADGGFRPAYTLQFATDTGSQVIVGVGAINAGTDHGQLAPMVDQREARPAEAPGATPADGGFATKEDSAAVSDRTIVDAPVPKPKDPTRDPHAPLPTAAPAVAAWRERMGTPEAQALYRERAATAECVNAQARNWGRHQLAVRGLAKVRVIALWYALAHNLARAIALGAVGGLLHRG
jgi:hypothetical protein